MKKLMVYALCGITMGLVACRQEKPSNEIIAHKEEPRPQPRTIQTVGDYRQSRTVAWVGAQYTVEVARMADKSLPVVDDGAGNRYYDNSILLRVIRKDGSEFFHRSFTKADFESCVDASYKKNSVLLGIVLDRAEVNDLYFAASVGSPDKMSDEYVPLVLKLSRMGDVSICKDTQLDTGGDADAPAQSELDLSEEEGI